MKRLQQLIRLVSLALLAAAVARELRMPSEQRAWHGEVAGFVPYDLRPPSVDRARAAFWNPDDPRMLTPTVFGVGWAVNFGRLWREAGQWV